MPAIVNLIVVGSNKYILYTEDAPVSGQNVRQVLCVVVYLLAWELLAFIIFSGGRVKYLFNFQRTTLSIK